MRIAIIHAPYSYQASTVRDSIESFQLYGQEIYELVQLRHGDFNCDLTRFDALILHYSCIAFPYKYFLPFTARSAMKIASFKGLKIALVQDEQRSGIERLQFFNVLGINHLFSVAEPDLYETLYPTSMRNFSLSTVLTGYISQSHLEVAQKKIPLIDRKVDICYRGRHLPNWMGKTAVLKGSVPDIINGITGIDSYITDLSSTEENRIYAAKWYEFLQKSRISIGTPSGSDYLDLEGQFLESWIPQIVNNQNEPKTPIAAKYQVISPRFFDYVAAGNLVVLTPGNYSNIPIQGTYFELTENLEEIVDIIEFAKTNEAQIMVDRCQHLILGNDELKYPFFVKQVERVISNFLPTLSNESSPRIHFNQSINNIESNRKKIVMRIRAILKSFKFLQKLYLSGIEIIRLVNISKNLNFLEILKSINQMPNRQLFHFARPRFIIELLNIFEIVGLLKDNVLMIEKFDFQTLIRVTPKYEILSKPTSTNNRIFAKNPHWILDLSYFGSLSKKMTLLVFPKIFRGDADMFCKWISKFD